MTRPALALLTAGAALALLTGCERKFTRDRFEMIRIGVDDRQDVYMILGEPTTDVTDQWIYNDLDHHYAAVIFFDDEGQVTGKEWTDASTGEWSGTNPHADPPPEGEVRERHRKTRRIDDD